MEIEYAKTALKNLAEDPRETGGFGQAVVRAYRRRLQQIAAAIDERDLYALKSLHFEKLQGKRKGEHSMRLNQQWRLIVEILPGEAKNLIRVLSIEDYH